MIVIVVEELLWYILFVVMMVNWWVIEDFIYKGYLIKRGDMIFIGIGFVNCDLNFFENLEILNLNWLFNRYIFFGFGIYFCLGVLFVRLEGYIVFNVFLKRFLDIEFVVVFDDIYWRKNVFLRGLENFFVLLLK